VVGARGAEPTPAGGAATTGTGRVGNVDVLRSVAALGVLLAHAYGLGGRELPQKAVYWYDVPLRSGSSGVWLFFGISGYVISKPFVDRLLTGRALPEVVPYALRRVLRIFPLYWVALTAVIIAGHTDPTRGWQYPLHFALLQNLVPNRQAALFSVAWTLSLEVLFYAAVPLVAFAIYRRRPRISAEQLALLVLVSWAASFALAVAADFYGNNAVGLWLRSTFPTMWQMFCPGILIAVAPHIRAPGWRRWLVELPSRRVALAGALAAVVIGNLLITRPPGRFGVTVATLVTDGSRPLFAIGFGVLIAAAVRARPLFQRRARFVLYLGLISYGIYLFHAVVATFLYGPFSDLIPLHEDTALAFFVHLAFLLALTIPLAMASWRWLEQPCIRLSGRLIEAWRARRTPAEPLRQPSAVP
jgi:peptidoglycan/LPS O-acetylase OafA/YrhL